jgi:excinuclease ABC subunit C
MAEHAEALEYEEAARIRDTIKAIENVMEKQVVASPDLVDRDIIAVAADRAKAVVTVMMVRSGFLIDTAHYPFDLGFRQGHEILAGFFEPYYRNTGFIPASILVNHKIDTREVLEHRLSEQKSRKVSIQTPVRGPKKKLVEMAVINASRELEKILEREEHDRAALVMLKQLMGMDRIASRIECFDNSNLSGQNPVSSMVVFTDGRPDKAQYRKFIIRDMEFQDDYAYMYQVLSRRFAKNPNQMPYPDLLVVDGGKGQLSVAMAVMRECGLEGRFAVAGIAKKDETKGEKFDKIYVPGRSNPLNTGPYIKALYLLQNVRDEAHRSVIGFQRKRREKIAGISILDNIPGIGPARKRTLLKHFKGISGILKADTKQIAALPGLNEKLAVQVKKVLGSDKS